MRARDLAKRGLPTMALSRLVAADKTDSGITPRSTG
ncbi:hypothetical protein [Ralstonia solanacearum]